LVRENCLPVIASAGTKADTFLSLPLPIQPSKLKAVPLSDYADPTRQFARNNAPLNLPRSHEKPRRGTSI
jgi:hypothetical protein